MLTYAGEPGGVVAEFVLRLAGEQVHQAALDALALEQRAMDLARDRHLDAEAIGQREGRLDRVGAFGRAGQVRLDLGPGPALGQLLAESMVARQAASRTSR